jgi:hypothetical protein
MCQIISLSRQQYKKTRVINSLYPSKHQETYFEGSDDDDDDDEGSVLHIPNVSMSHPNKRCIISSISMAAK